MYLKQFVVYFSAFSNAQLILRSLVRLLVLRSLSNLSTISRCKKEPTIDRAVDAALPSPPMELVLLLLLLEILTGFVTSKMFTANFNSATSASHGVICMKDDN